MISLLTGKIVERGADSIILDVNGVGYELLLSTRTLAQIQDATTLTLYAYLHVREDAMILYGFNKKEEKELFLMLLKITGIGPKLALAIQGMADAGEFKRKVLEGDVSYFEMIPGVGSRMANRLIVELQGKIEKMLSVKEISPGKTGDLTSDAMKALLALGYPRQQVQKMVQSVMKSKGEDISIEEFLKHALHKADLK